MEGKVLGFNQETKEGVIKNQDGLRYNFSLEDWKSEETPKQNLEVDFVADNDRARDIYVTSKSILSTDALKNANEKLKDVESKISNSFDKVSQKISSLKDKSSDTQEMKKRLNLNGFKLYNILAGGIVVLLVAFIFIKNYYATEAFKKELHKYGENIIYSKASCSGLFSTNCSLENLELYSNGGKILSLEEISLSNVGSLAKIQDISEKSDIDVAMNVENIILLKKDFLQLNKSFLKLDDAVMDYIYGEFSKKSSLNIEATLTVANGKILRANVEEILLENSFLPVNVNMLVENISLNPSLKSMSIQINSDDILEGAYKIYSEAFLNFSEQEKINSFHKKSLKVCQDKLSESEFKTSFTKMIAYSSNDEISQMFFNQQDGIKLSFNSPQGMTVEGLIMNIFSDNRWRHFAPDFSFEVKPYGDVNPLVKADVNSIIEERKNYLKSFGIEEDKVKVNEEKRNKLSEQLGSYTWGRLPNPAKEESEVLEVKIFDAIPQSTKELLIANLDKQYKCYQFDTNINKNSRKRVVLNNKEYTFYGAYSQLKDIKRQNPEKISSALHVVSEKFAPEMEVEQEFLKERLQTILNDNLSYNNITACYPFRRFDFLDYSISKSVEEKLDFLKKNTNLVRRLDNQYSQEYVNSYNKHMELWKQAKKSELDSILTQYKELDKEILVQERIINSVSSCKDTKCLERVKFESTQCNGEKS